MRKYLALVLICLIAWLPVRGQIVQQIVVNTAAPAASLPWGTMTPACGSASGTTPTFQSTSAPSSQTNACSPSIPSGALVIYFSASMNAFTGTPFSNSNGDTLTACPGLYGTGIEHIALFVGTAGAVLTSVTSSYGSNVGFRATTEIAYITGQAASFVDFCSDIGTFDFNSPISTNPTGTLGASSDLILSGAIEPNNGVTPELPTPNTATSGTCISLYTDTSSGWNASNLCYYATSGGTASQTVTWTIAGGQTTAVVISAVRHI
jgi:hypothetical protein